MIARMILLAMALAVATPASAAPWVLIARKATQRIHHMQEGAQDFAAVILEAPAANVYATALDLARKNRQVMILVQDPVAHRLQIQEGDRTATLTVVEFSPEVSQLLIAGTAQAGETGTASRVVAAVMRVCAEMKKDCRLDQR